MNDAIMKKKVGRMGCMLSFLFLSFILLFIAGNKASAATGYTARKTVRVGYFPFDGYHMEDEKGVKSGYGYDILQSMLLYENWKYEYVGYKENISWDKAQELLAEGKIDLLTSATKNPDRLKKYAYSNIPIGNSSAVLTVRAGDNRYDTSDYSDWNGITVGMLYNNTRNDSFKKYAGKHGFSFHKREYTTPDQLLTALKEKKVDMIVTSNLLIMSGVQIIDKFDEKPFYVIVKKNNTKLLEQVNDALVQIQEKNPSFAENLYQTYYNPKTDGVVSFSKAEQKYIDSCKKNKVILKAVINPDRKPLTYMENNKEKGLLVDISKEIFKRTGLTIQFENLKNRKEYVSRINHGQADIICDFTRDESAAENYGYVSTNPYYNSSVSMLVRKEYHGSGKVCALTKDSITNSKVLGQKGIKYVYYSTNKACQNAVLNGEADFTYSYTRVVQEKVYADITNSLASITVNDLSVDIKMAVNLRQNSLLPGIISKSVDSISEKDISFLSEPYTYYNRDHSSLLSVIYEHPVVLFAGILVAAVVVVGVIILVISINGHKKEKKNNGRLQMALEDADKANQAKTVFLSRMSHDMRTPLNAIKNYALFMEDTNSVTELQGYGNRIIESENYLETLINDTLGMSRIESGKVELSLEPYCYAQFEPGIRNVVEPRAKEKNVTLRFIKPEQTSHYVLLDKLRVQQIIVNIVNNAIKFTPPGGVVEVKVDFINRSSVHEDIQFTVSDTGIGMSEEFQQTKLFHPFSQERPGIDNEYTGTGLGMSIVKELVKIMKGTILCKSKPGLGTTFIVTLPVEISKVQNVSITEKIKTDITQLKGCHILLCEDHPLNREIALRLLHKAGCIVDVAEDGEKAYVAFKESQNGSYDAILMDVRMPNMDGLQATRAIRGLARQDAKEVPIIAMTANAYEEDRKRTREAGMNAHLAKPISPEKMYQVLCLYVNTKKKE